MNQTAAGDLNEGAQPAHQAPALHPGKRYTGAALHVLFDGPRCIHAAECVRGLPAVFDRDRRPWILPDGALAEELVAVVERCPTGALHYERVDGGPQEAPDGRNTVCVQPSGPYYVRGRLRVATAEGTLLIEDVRLALCRCGRSQHKPFCDNAHLAAGFSDPGRVAANAEAALPEHGELSMELRTNGPIILAGHYEIIGAGSIDGTGAGVHRGEKAALCRCGGSADKPFCDGTHKRNGFVG